MATHSSILAWRATVHGAAESDTAEQLTLLPEGALVCMFPWLFTTRLGTSLMLVETVFWMQWTAWSQAFRSGEGWGQ